MENTACLYPQKLPFRKVAKRNNQSLHCCHVQQLSLPEGTVGQFLNQQDLYGSSRLNDLNRDSYPFGCFVRDLVICALWKITGTIEDPSTDVLYRELGCQDVHIFRIQRGIMCGACRTADKNKLDSGVPVAQE